MTGLVLRPEAERDLEEIERYSFQTFSAGTAEDYLEDIRKALRFLSSTPEAGAVHLTVRPAIRSWSVGKHKIFYDYRGTDVEVARILHQAMDPTEHL